MPIKKGGSATFTVVEPPAPRADRGEDRQTDAEAGVATLDAAAARPKPRHRRPVPGGGGSWAAAEAYYLRLMNCTRTGGCVNAIGGCDSPGGRSVAPLRIDRGISAQREPAVREATSRAAGSAATSPTAIPATRLRRAGYDSYKWAENISCPKIDERHGS